MLGSHSMLHTSPHKHVCSPEPCSLWHMPLPSQTHDTTVTSASLLVTSSREGAVNNAALTSNATVLGSHSRQVVSHRDSSTVQEAITPPAATATSAARLSVSPGPLHSQCCQARGTGYQAPCPKEAREACRSTLPHPLAHRPLQEEQLTSAYGHALAQAEKVGV